MSPGSDAVPAAVSGPGMLVVEGRDDEWFLKALMTHLGLQNSVDIVRMDGKTNLRPTLHGLWGRTGFGNVSSLAILRDADDNPSGTLQSVNGALQAEGFVASAHGVFSVGQPRVGIFVLPDGASPGNLETLCLRSVAGRPEMQCVHHFHRCLKGLTRKPSLGVKLGNKHKLRCHAFIASQRDPGLRLGEAAWASYWVWGSPAFDELRRFLQGL